MNEKSINNNRYINSDIAWLGDIPNHWTLMRGKYCMACNKIIVGNKVDEYDRLALTLNGVVKRSKDANDGLQPSDFATYQIVKPNQLVFKLIDLQNISTSRVGRSDYLGIVSPAYIVLECGEKLNPRYAEKYYLSMWQREIFNTLGDDGVRSNLNAKDLLDLPILVPPLEEQKRIADFIDNKCHQIDEIIDGLKQKSNSLQEYKKAITRELVTKGIDNKNFIESGVHWIGTIPENWVMIPNKYLFKEMTKKVGSKWEQTQLLSLTTNGIRKKGFDEIGGKMPESYDNYLEVKEGQLVMCLFDLDVSAVFSDLSPYDGMITSAYHVYDGSNKIDMRYADYFFRFVFDNRNYKLYSKSLRYTISSDGFKNIKTPVPPLEEQKRIADYLDDQYKKINEICDGIKEEIRILEDYKKSLIYEYVTGKKVVKDE